MELLLLVLLYYFSQNPDFHESVKPLMSQLKNSQQMLSFLNDLSNFAKTFSSVTPTPPPCDEPKPCGEKPCGENPTTPPCEAQEKKENPQSPTSGIADAFIQQILDGYLNKKG